MLGLQKSTYAMPPSRFEPGTPAIAEAIGLGAAVDYLSEIGMDAVAAHEEELGGLLHQEVCLYISSLLKWIMIIKYH